jgi:hypothetical protein
MDKNTFTFAIEAAQKVLVHAEGGPAQILAVGVAGAVVFVGAFVSHGIKQVIETKIKAA